VSERDPERNGRARWQFWPGWLIAYIVTLVVIRDIVLTLLQ
jgi:hypothetical protein